MAGITDTQAIRFGEVTDPQSYWMLRNEADDIAAQLNLADAQATAALKMPAGIALRTTALALPVTTFTAVPFNVEQQDTHAMIDIAGQPTRLTASATAGAGLYMVGFQAQCDTTGWTRADIVLQKNGATYCRSTFNSPQSFGFMHVFTEIYLGTVGDYVSFQLYHEGGGTTNAVEVYAWIWKVADN